MKKLYAHLEEYELRKLLPDDHPEKVKVLKSPPEPIGEWPDLGLTSADAEFMAQDEFDREELKRKADILDALDRAPEKKRASFNEAVKTLRNRRTSVLLETLNEQIQQQRIEDMRRKILKKK